MFSFSAHTKNSEDGGNRTQGNGVLPVLLEQEGEEHEQTAVVHNPPDVNIALHTQTSNNRVNGLLS